MITLLSECLKGTQRVIAQRANQWMAFDKIELPLTLLGAAFEQLGARAIRAQTISTPQLMIDPLLPN